MATWSLELCPSRVDSRLMALWFLGCRTPGRPLLTAHGGLCSCSVWLPGSSARLTPHTLRGPNSLVSWPSSLWVLCRAAVLLAQARVSVQFLSPERCSKQPWVLPACRAPGTLCNLRVGGRPEPVALFGIVPRVQGDGGPACLKSVPSRGVSVQGYGGPAPSPQVGGPQGPPQLRVPPGAVRSFCGDRTPALLLCPASSSQSPGLTLGFVGTQHPACLSISMPPSQTLNLQAQERQNKARSQE